MKFRKTLSLLLVLAMIMSTAPLHVRAATETAKAAAIEESVTPEEDAGDHSGVDPAAEEETAGTSADGDQTAGGTDDGDAAAQPSEEDTDAVDEAADEDTVYTRTIMMYICGSNLETYSAMATYNIQQILEAKFSKEDRVKFIIMTGGSDEWNTPSDLLVDPENPEETINVDPEYNQVWEAKGADAAENPGKMVLLKKEGLHGEKARDKESEEDEEDEVFHGELMSDPQLLKDFINYCADEYPAEKYDLILWDHGSGPIGGFANDEGKFFREMTFAEIMDAFSDNNVTKDGGKFDFINFDACLMGSVELMLAFSEYMDYYIASAENIPGYGEYYTGWLNKLGEDPDHDTYKLGKLIVDDYISFYEDDSSERTSGEGTLAVINMDRLVDYSGFTDGILKLPACLKQQATELNPVLNGYLFYDEFDSGKNSIRYGGDMNYYDLGILVSQLRYNFKELDGDLYSDGTVNDTNIYTENLAQISALLDREEMIYARGTKGIRSNPLYYRDTYGKTNFGSVGTSGLYIYFPRADYASDVLGYFNALTPVIKKLEKTPKADGAGDDSTRKEIRDFLDNYRHALLDYALIAKTGRGVTMMLDEGYERSSINYDSFREYFTGGAEPSSASDDIEDDENIDYTICDWNAEFMDYLLLRAGMDSNAPYSQHAAAEAASRDWLAGVIKQQAEENIRRKDMKLDEGENGQRILMQNTRKRVVEDVRYNIEALIPAAEKYLTELQEAGELELMSPEEKEALIRSKIGYVTGEPVVEKADGTKVDQDSPIDYLEWYNEPGGIWDLPPIEESWYTVKDANNYYHIANIETDEIADEIYFYGNYKSENGIDTLCSLSFDKNGNLDQILLGTEDGQSYRRIPASELLIEVEVMPIRSATIFVDDVSIPLSQKPIIVSPDTVGEIKLVKKDLNDIDDLKTDGGDAAIERTVVVRDIYGYEIPITKEDSVDPEDPSEDPEDPSIDPEDPSEDPEDPSGDPESTDDTPDQPGHHTDSPKTGDESDAALWLVLMSASAAGLLFIRRKKTR